MKDHTEHYIVKCEKCGGSSTISITNKPKNEKWDWKFLECHPSRKTHTLSDIIKTKICD